jgi:hypothetical protein
MTWNEATRPSDHRIATASTYDNIFMSDESVTFTLTTGAATTYEVRNYYGTVVASGSISGTTLNLGVMPLGWFKLYLIRPTAIASPWGFAGGETYFVVCRAGLGLPARPTNGTSAGADPDGQGVDYPAQGFTRLGPYRHSLRNDTNHASDLTACLSDVALEASTWGTADTARPLVPIANYTNGQGSLSSATVTSAVSQLVAAGCSTIEGMNEPNVGIPVASTYVSTFSTFSAAVRAGGGLVGGPCTIGVDGVMFTGASTNREWMRQFLINGGTALIDVVSFHNYGGVGGSLRLGRATLDGFIDLLTITGNQSKPRFNSEAFSYFAHVYGSTEVRVQTEQTMLEMQLLEQYGLPKERTSFFYGRSHGFWGYPSWWINNESDQTPNPLVAVARVWSQELAGKAYSARLNFGSEDDQFVGSRFTASSGASTVTFQSDGREGNLTFTVTGASTVDTVDAWGNVTTRAVSGGTITVPANQLPSYIRCPSGVTATPVAVNYGIDAVAPQRTMIGLTAPASDVGFPASAVIDADVSTYRATSTTLPADVVVTFPTKTRFDRVVVRTAPPWQLESALLDFDIDAKVGGSWTTVGTFTEPTPVVTWASHADVGRGFTDSYYSRKSTWVLELATAVEATDVRVHVRDVTYGGGATLATTNGGGLLTVGDTGQTGPRRVCLSEVRVYLSGTTDGGTAVAGQPMLIVG